MTPTNPTRRAILGAAAGAALLDARSYARIAGANDRVTMGVIGCGGRGRFVSKSLLGQGADIAAACDPDRSQIEKLQSMLPAKAAEEKDFRRLLDRKDIDAVLIATPDHWHALPFVHAVRSGKDVYMEKPTAYTVAESRAMVEAAKASKSVVQIGTQQMSGDHYKRAVEQVRDGDLGTVSRVRFWNVWNNTSRTGGGRSGGLGNPPDGPAPAGVDYDLWLGPAPARPFNPARFHWNYVYFWDYGGGMMSGWAVHHLDVIHRAMGADAPKAVSAVGGKYVLTDARETPDTLDALFEYPGFIVQGSMYHANARPIEGRDYGVAFYGTKATLVIDRTGYEVWPEGNSKDAVKYPGSEQESAHAKNFLAAVKSRATPSADIAAGHRASIPALLANVSYRTGRKLTWDAERERFVGDPEADKSMTREYRKPWAFPG